MPGGRGIGSNEGGMGRGSSYGSDLDMGATGKYVCMKCGYSIPKKAGIPCMDEYAQSAGLYCFERVAPKKGY